MEVDDYELRETRLLLESLKRDRPDRYGLLENNIEEVYEVVSGCERSYPCSRNLYSEDLDLPESSFGRVLSQLEEIGVYNEYSNGENAVNRYDFTELNRERLDVLYEELSD